MGQSKEAYLEKVANMKKTLDNGVDIMAKTDEQIANLVTLYGVEFGEDERILYKDNCLPDEETGICPRLRWCGGTDTQWLSKARERQRKMEKQEHLAKKKVEMYNKTCEELRKFHEESSASAVLEKISCSDINDDGRDLSYIPGKTSYQISKVTKLDSEHKMATRARGGTTSTVSKAIDLSAEDSENFTHHSTSCSVTEGAATAASTDSSAIGSSSLGSSSVPAVDPSPFRISKVKNTYKLQNLQSENPRCTGSD